MKKKPVIWIDSREKNNQHITDCFADKRIDYFVSKLPIGDYMSLDNARLIIERKNSILEIVSTIGAEHERFKKELKDATKYGIHIIILIEEEGFFCLEDVKSWVHPYIKKNPRAMTGETIYKILSAYTQYYDVEIQFTCKGDSAQRILELLKAT